MTGEVWCPHFTAGRLHPVQTTWKHVRTEKWQTVTKSALFSFIHQLHSRLLQTIGVRTSARSDLFCIAHKQAPHIQISWICMKLWDEFGGPKNKTRRLLFLLCAIVSTCAVSCWIEVRAPLIVRFVLKRSVWQEIIRQLQKLTTFSLPPQNVLGRCLTQTSHCTGPSMAVVFWKSYLQI